MDYEKEEHVLHWVFGTEVLGDGDMILQDL